MKGASSHWSAKKWSIVEREVDAVEHICEPTAARAERSVPKKAHAEGAGHKGGAVKGGRKEPIP